MTTTLRAKNNGKQIKVLLDLTDNLGYLKSAASMHLTKIS